MKHRSFFMIGLSWLLLGSWVSPGLSLGRIPKANFADMSLDGAWFARVESSSLDLSQVSHIDPANWRSISLPGNAVDLGLGEGPVFLFAKVFDFPREMRNSITRLAFQGIDYQASVWLNGHYLGEHTGYFEPFAFTVATHHFKPHQNVLIVRVSAYPETNTLQKKYIKGVLSHHDTRPGGAWSERGNEKTTGGIWGSVSLHFSKRVAIQNWSLNYTLSLGNQMITPKISMSLFHASKRARTFDFVLQLKPKGFLPEQLTAHAWRKAMTLDPGQTLVNWQLSERQVALWWPYELGTPHLYDFTINVFQRGNLVAQNQREVGFRQITREQDTGIWHINGQRIFLRGTNYIGTIWLAQMTPTLVKRDVSLMKQAHINSVRVHAHITHPDFYRECDREGLLIWQDFPLQWGYEDRPDFEKEALKQAKSMVTLLRHHPSIFTWCPHNEPPWDAGWMAYKYPDYQPDQNRILNQKLVKALRAADTTRYVHPHSATAEHPWLGWYSGHWRDYGKPTQETMITEYGAQALPSEATLRRFIPAERLFPKSDADWTLWEYHNFQPKETFTNAGISRGNSLSEFIENSQNYQSRLIKKAVESYRMQRFEPVTSIFQFMFVEHWPSINWGVVDYLRNPKPGWSALQRAYQPILPLIVDPEDVLTSDINPRDLQLWVVNDSHQKINNAQVVLTLGKETSSLWKKAWVQTLDPDEKTKVASFQMPPLPHGSHTLWLEVRQPDGKLIALNDWSFSNQLESMP